jgi:hypothetical protein
MSQKSQTTLIPKLGFLSGEVLRKIFGHQRQERLTGDMGLASYNSHCRGGVALVINEYR